MVWDGYFPGFDLDLALGKPANEPKKVVYGVPKEDDVGVGRYFD